MTGNERKPIRAWSISFKIVALYARRRHPVHLLLGHSSRVAGEGSGDPHPHLHVQRDALRARYRRPPVPADQPLHREDPAERGGVAGERAAVFHALREKPLHRPPDRPGNRGDRRRQRDGVRLLRVRQGSVDGDEDRGHQHPRPDEVVSGDRAGHRSGRKSLLFFTHRLANGELRDVEVHSAPIVLQGRKVLYSIVHDISARKKAELALRDGEERYRRLSREFQALLDAIPDNLVSLSPDLKIRWMNSVAVQSPGKGHVRAGGPILLRVLVRKDGAVRGVPRAEVPAEREAGKRPRRVPRRQDVRAPGGAHHGTKTERWCRSWRWAGTSPN